MEGGESPRINPKTKERYYEPPSREQEEDGIRIIMVGLTGNGKSSSANTIFTTEETRQKVFKTSAETASTTDAADIVTKTVRNKKITIVDTPGTQHNKMSPRDVATQLRKTIQESQDGFDAFLVTHRFRDNGISKDEKETLRQLDKIFENGNKDFFEYVIFIFTHGDSFERYRARKATDNEECLEFEEEMFRSMFSTCEDAIGPIIKKAKGGAILFNNKDDVSLEAKIEMSKELVMKVEKLKRGNTERYTYKNLPQKKYDCTIN